MDAKKLKIGNKSYTQVVDGEPLDTDITFRGDLYREDQPITVTPAPANPAPTAQSADTATPVTTAPVPGHPWYERLSFKRALGWLAILALVAILILGIIYAANNIGPRQAASPATGASSAQGETLSTGTLSEATVLDLGSIGSYHAVYDSKEGQWTLGIWDENMIREGTGLSEFKAKASSVSFVMPFDGVINNSAGHLSVNGTEWKLGNPVVDSNGNNLIKAGDSVTIWSDGPNESFGFQIWFQ